MTVYVGTYPSGDFFKHPSVGDIKEALQMCDELKRCPYLEIKGGDICFQSAPPFFNYANWEGQITGSDQHFRLDLQGKPTAFNPDNIVWLGKQPTKSFVPTTHIAQWQLQFGAKGAQRVTRKDGPSDGYRTAYKGALAGVMMGINHWVTIDDFKEALLQSFTANAGNGNTFGVVMSTETYIPKVKSTESAQLPKARFVCNNTWPCNGLKVTVVFKDSLEKLRNIRITRFGNGGWQEIPAIQCPRCQASLLEYDSDMKVTDPVDEWVVFYV